MPTDSPFSFSVLLERVRQALPPDLPVYLVGGAVRDTLLSRSTHDLDFVLPGDALAVGRKVAKALEAAFYPLDEERDTARLILSQPDGSRQILDFAALRGPDLESDLRARDFTVNAMAVSVHEPQALLDPLGGVGDLRAKLLRACSPTAFQDDPLRILRAVRQAAAYNFYIVPETRALMRQAVSQLRRVSPERMRDELFRILGGPQPATALRALDLLDVLPYVLPELPKMKGVTQSPPHVFDIWQHTLHVLQKLETVLEVLGLRHNPEAAASLALGQLSIRLGRYRQQIHDQLETSLNPERSHHSLLLMAALYHDIGKPQTRQEEEEGRIRFLDHEQVGARLVAHRASELRLSNAEADRLETVVRHHMRPLLLAQSGELPSRRAVYRFFRDTGPAGIDICLVSLADVLGTYGPALPQETWSSQIEVVRTLLEAWWEHPAEAVLPPALLNGHELMNSFDLKPGPKIGELLEAIREAQATGEVQDREQALKLARDLLNRG